MKAILTCLIIFCFAAPSFACIPTSSTDTHVACGQFTWINGVTYMISNHTAVVVMANAEGCDSTVTLDLTILPNSYGTDFQSACDTYTWINGITYTENNTTATFPLVSATGCDSIVTLNLDLTHSVETIQYEVSCGPYVWDDGNTYPFPGMFSQHFTAANGCDSVAKLSLMIQPKPEAEAVPLDEYRLYAQVTGYANFYSWIDCSTMTQIPGFTTDTLVMPGNGSYAVVATLDFCSDTSECLTINNVSLEEQGNSCIALFPNPSADGIFTIAMPGIAEASVVVYDLNGKAVKTISRLKQGETVSLAEFENGIYLVHLQTTEGMQVVLRLVKE